MTTPPLDLPAERLTALRAIANAATDGEWVEYNPCDGESHISIAHKVAWRSVESATPFADDEVIPHWADARHIAAFDPPTARALLDRVEKAERDAFDWERSFKAERADKYMSDDAAKAWRLRAESAEKKVAAVREALEAHPKACDRHTEDDPIKCGWKRAVADVTRALDSTPYQTLSTEPLVSTHHTPETETTP